MSKVYVIHHRGCIDGQVAAYVSKKKLPSAELIATYYGESPPEIEEGSDVYVVDFSLTEDTINELAPSVNKIVIIDHHKTAFENLISAALPKNVTLVLDSTKSGALLTWEYFNIGKKAPAYVKYANDYDLWLFEHPGTKEYVRYLKSIEFSFNAYDELFKHNTESQIRAMGAVLIDDDYIKIKWYHENTLRFVDILGYKNVPFINCPKYMVSEVLNSFLVKNKQYRFAAGYHDGNKQRFIRLNSLKESGFNVRALAETMGGGGHDSAASFRVNRDHPLAKI